MPESAATAASNAAVFCNRLSLAIVGHCPALQLLPTAIIARRARHRFRLAALCSLTMNALPTPIGANTPSADCDDDGYDDIVNRKQASDEFTAGTNCSVSSSRARKSLRSGPVFLDRPASQYTVLRYT